MSDDDELGAEGGRINGVHHAGSFRADHPAPPPVDTRGAAAKLSVMSFQYVPHPHIARHKELGPVKVADQLPRHNAAARFNSWLAIKVTTGVGTMWCAYAFAALALVSLPSAIKSGDPVILVSWISQTFLQLVLLSVIIVGQNIQGAASDKRAEDTYKDAEAVLQESIKIQEHLTAQDATLAQMIADLNRREEAAGLNPATSPESGPAQ
jgi:hypothetical protein